MKRSTAIRRSRSRIGQSPAPWLAFFLLCFAVYVPLGAPAWSAEVGDPAYLEEIRQWRRDRVERLTAEDGWLTLVGLFWLAEGAHSLGSGADNDIRLPPGSAPDKVGTILVEGSEVRIEALAAAGVRTDGRPVQALTLADDSSGAPTRLRIGDLSCHLIKRGDRYALRVKDPTTAARLDFPGIEHYDPAEPWRIGARFEAYDPPRKLPVPTVVDNTLQEMSSPGAVVFAVGGDSFRIEAQAESADSPLFLIFGDRTNGRTTYGGGRYLYTDPPSADGRVTVDFNKAYNPPCVYTPYATCPLPPRENRLDIAIEAGEKYAPISPKP